MLVIGYPKCSTVQKAKKWLDENGYRYEERNIKEEPPNLRGTQSMAPDERSSH